MSLEKLKQDLKKLTEAKFRLDAKAKKEGRELDAKEQTMMVELEGAIDGIQDEIKNTPANAPLTLGSDSILGGGEPSTSRNGGLRVIGASEPKKYANMWVLTTGLPML